MNPHASIDDHENAYVFASSVLRMPAEDFVELLMGEMTRQTHDVFGVAYSWSAAYADAVAQAMDDDWDIEGCSDAFFYDVAADTDITPHLAKHALGGTWSDSQSPQPSMAQPGRRPPFRPTHP